jgi:Flp pilus assembly protein TadD
MIKNKFNRLIFALVLCFAAQADTQINCSTIEHSINNPQNFNTCLNLFKQAKRDNKIDDIVKYAFIVSKLYRYEKKYDLSNEVLQRLNKNYSPLINTTITQHKILREIGQNYYFLKQYSKSLLNFQKAFDIAQVDNQLLAMAKSYNDLGVVYKAQSRYTDALKSYMQSLKIKQALNLTFEIANTLNNIGNIYILMNDFNSAYNYHNNALKQYLILDHEEVAEMLVHVRNQIGVSLKKIESLDAAIIYLEKSIYETTGSYSQHLLFDTYCDLAEFYLEKNLIHKAETIMQKTSIGDEISAEKKLLRYMVMSKINTIKKNYNKAEQLGQKGLELAKQVENSEQITLFFSILANIKQQMQQYQAANQYQQQYIESKETYLKQRYNTEIKYLQNEIEIQQQQKDLHLLQKNNQIQELQIKKQRLRGVIFVLINIFLILLIFWLVLKKTNERKKLLNQINYHRKKLKQMQAPSEQLEKLFQSITEPLICINQAGNILFHNDLFKHTYIHQKNTIIGDNFKHIYPNLSQTLTKITFNAEDLPNDQHLIHTSNNGQSIHMWINTLNFYDNAIIISFQENTETRNLPTKTQQFVKNANNINSMVKKLNAVMNDNDPALTNQLIQQLDKKLTAIDSQQNLSENYRSSLINLMCTNLDVWRKITQGDRISLAEKSSIWRVTIDEGRLRTRAMDRYLSLKLLPKSPRWRPVVKTSHYILSECKLTEEQRTKLNELLEIFMVNLRARSLQS